MAQNTLVILRMINMSQEIATQGAVTRGHGVLEGFLARQRCKMANRLIPTELRDGRLLDIGCGSYPFFLQNTVFAEKFGLDKMAGTEQIEEFQSHGISLLKHDVESQTRLPFDDDSLQIVTMLAVFEHIKREDLVCLLREVRRILAPEGLFVMTTPAAWSDGLLKVMARVSLVSSEEIDEHQDAYNHAKISAILQEAGFAPSALKCGYFEGFLNLWVTASG